MSDKTIEALVQELYPGANGTWEEGLITDAFRQPFYVGRAELQYSELRVVATPLLPEVVETVDDRVRNSDSLQGTVLVAETMAASIAWWSLTKGKPTAQQVRRMRPAQFNKLYRILSGKIPSDVDPRLVQKAEEANVEPLAPMGKS